VRGRRFCVTAECSTGERHHERRGVLVALLAAAVVPAHPAHAAYSAPSDTAAPSSGQWSRYTRSTRERFETSISSATRAYTLEFPSDWTQDVVSLNDGKLYGVDLRLRSPDKSGQLAVSCLPYVGRATLADAGGPSDVLNNFVELIGAFWDSNGFGRDGGLAGKVLSAKEERRGGLLFYNYETASHNLISATTVDGELYVLTVSAGGERGWRSNEAALRRIAQSFSVPA